MSNPSLFNSLKEALTDWQDVDVTVYYIGRCLGIINHDIPFSSTKGLIYSSNPVSALLHNTLDRLVELRALEYDEEEQRYRWNRSFKLDY